MKIHAVFLSIVLVIASTNTLRSQWTQTGLTNGNGYSLVVSGANLFTGTKDAIYLSTDEGRSWTKVLATGTEVRAFSVSDTKLYASTIAGGVFLSTNNGISWVNTGLTNSYVYSLATSGSTVFAGGYERVNRSTNEGTTWSSAHLTAGSGDVFSLAVAGGNILAGTYSGGVFRSTNNGTSWKASNSGLPSPNIRALVVSGNRVLAGTLWNGVFESTDNGVTWSPLNTGIENLGVLSIAVNGTYLVAGSWGGGAALSVNNGTSWISWGTGLPGTTPTVYALALIGAKVFGGVEFDGLWTRSILNWSFLLAPANRIGGIKSPVTFKWKSDPQALAYAFQIATDAGFSNLVVNQSTVDTSYMVSSLQSATVYYWRVRAENTTWASEWGTGTFTTKLRAAPQLTSPTSGAMLVSKTPTLRWTPIVSSATYLVQVSPSSSFRASSYSLDTASTSVVVPQLQGSTKYYWRVRAQVPPDRTVWSSVNSFTTFPDVPKIIPLIYPDSAKQGVFQNDWLLWRSDPTATRYLVQISRSPLFTGIYDSATTGSAVYRNPSKPFAQGLTYFWRVRGSNVAGDGTYSQVWSFKVGSSLRKPIATFSRSNIAFGKVKVGQSKGFRLVVTNKGNDTLKIANVFATSQAFTVNRSALIVPPSRSIVDAIRFTATTAGNASSSIVITSNAPSSPDTIKATGFGVTY